MKKVLLVSTALFIGGISFADDENYDGQTVSEDFSGKSMNYSSWVGANISNSNFSNAKLKETVFTNAKISATDFSKSNLTNAIFDNITCYKGNFSYAVLVGVSFKGAHLLPYTSEYNTYTNFKGRI